MGAESTEETSDSNFTAHVNRYVNVKLPESIQGGCLNMDLAFHPPREEGRDMKHITSFVKVHI